ncbi:MAG: DUF1499 domain-containing protein [Proteobacteria bacterium]|nr:DUF1499 domain-containing protein [Pseudomonadota bacterium]
MRRQLPPMPQSGLAIVAERFSLLAVPVAAGGVLATRAGQIAPENGIAAITFAAILATIALAAAFVAAIDIWRNGYLGLDRLARAMLVAGVLLAFPAYLAYQSFRLPALNDITTDLDDPPLFSTSARSLAEREGHRPPEVLRARREIQRRAYPAIRTLVIEGSAEEAFQSVLGAIRQLKWKVIEEVRPDDRRGIGRIEAIDESRLMRFRDDITIRFRQSGDVTRVDIRSASRIGRHDFGANAARILRLQQEIANPSE